MDMNEQVIVEKTETPKLELPAESISYLNETQKWTKFLAILGFIFMGLIVLLGFSIGTLISTFGGDSITTPFPSIFIGFLYLVIAAIYFFPILYLFKFSRFAKKAITGNDTNNLNQAFKNLNSHYRFIGILTIIGLGFYAIIILIFAIIAIFSGGLV